MKLRKLFGLSSDIMILMRDFNRGGSTTGRGYGGGGRGGYSGGGNRGGYNDRSRGGDRGGDREMFSATCDSCGKSCELPFKPTGSKPVYCSDCFRKQDGGDTRRSGGFDRGNDRRSDSRDSRPSAGPDMSGVHAKLDKIIELLSAPTSKQKKEAVKEVLAEEMLVTPDEQVMTTDIIPEAAEVVAETETKPKRKSKKTEEVVSE